MNRCLNCGGETLDIILHRGEISSYACCDCDFTIYASNYDKMVREALEEALWES